MDKVLGQIIDSPLFKIFVIGIIAFILFKPAIMGAIFPAPAPTPTPIPITPTPAPTIEPTPIPTPAPDYSMFDYNGGIINVNSGQYFTGFGPVMSYAGHLNKTLLVNWNEYSYMYTPDDLNLASGENVYSSPFYAVRGL